ncbi:tail fiber domain-containing protein [Achromobacter mucicolens]|uniref:tail fiber domain-containing protein n=1 Tax=Achromobacter mucicolens TaxID=1389922 RepID=UPI0020A4B880|nr:tail fiber domain-containing protein [Achromobacter mucicolens]MCP2517394.1 tail fiber domain-containing protein [Achromobacter mucicolens]
MGCMSSEVKQDPAVGRAQEANAQIGMRAQDLAERNFEWNKELTDQFAPIYQGLMNNALGEATKNAERGDDQWQQYKDIFQPIENKMAEEAMNYDSAEEVARREGLAAATVGRQFDNAQEQTSREMARMGVSPTSSLGNTAMTDQANARALATAGAVTKERSDTKILGMSLRENAARFGRNQTGTGIAASQAALQAGNSATGVMGAQTAQGNAAGTGQGLLGTASAAYGTMGNLGLSQMQMQQQANSSSQAGLGSLIGTGVMAGAMMFSSKELKEDGAPVDDDAALDGLTQVPVESWKYQNGVADGGRHVGPYAEDMQAAFGDEVAPAGVGLDMISVSGKHHAAIRALAKKVERLERRRQDRGGASLERMTVPEEISAGDSVPPALSGDLFAGLIGLERI